MEGISEKSYLLIDDNIVNVMANIRNSILISPYIGNPLDMELSKLMEFLTATSKDNDMRESIPLIFSFDEVINHFKDKN